MDLARLVPGLLALVGGSGVDEPRATVISAAPQFAPTSFARARLLRQAHACGLLSADEHDQARLMLEAAR